MLVCPRCAALRLTCRGYLADVHGPLRRALAFLGFWVRRAPTTRGSKSACNTASRRSTRVEGGRVPFLIGAVTYSPSSSGSRGGTEEPGHHPQEIHVKSDSCAGLLSTRLPAVAPEAIAQARADGISALQARVNERTRTTAAILSATPTPLTCTTFGVTTTCY